MEKGKEIVSLQTPVPRIKYECSLNEIGVIKALREVSYGELEVHMMNGEPRRVIKKESVHLDDAIDIKEIASEIDTEELLAKQLNSIKRNDGK